MAADPRHACPLAGVRVLSLAQQYPGPYAASLLADLGADVILVERPGAGDPTRRCEGHFEALNRNTRGVAIDLKSPRGRQDFLDLLGTAHVLIEGFRPGVMHRLGLGAEQLHKLHPELVYVSISAFGQSGPMASVAGHDLSVQGTAGMLGLDPRKASSTEVPKLPLSDIASAMFAVVGVLSALLARSSGAPGCHVDVSMFDTLVSWLTPFLVPAVNGLRPVPLPPQDPGYGIFHCDDGVQLTLSIAGEDTMWSNLCELLDLPELQTMDLEQRVACAPRASALLREAIATRRGAELLAQLRERGIAHGPIQQVDDLVRDAHVAARELLVDVPGPRGTMRHVRQPLLFDGRAGPVLRPAPSLGEHNASLRKEIDALRLQRATRGA